MKEITHVKIDGMFKCSNGKMVPVERTDLAVNISLERFNNKNYLVEIHKPGKTPIAIEITPDEYDRIQNILIGPPLPVPPVMPVKQKTAIQSLDMVEEESTI